MLKLNWTINYCIRKTILSEDCLIYITIIVIFYFTIQNTVVWINFNITLSIFNLFNHFIILIVNYYTYILFKFNYRVNTDLHLRKHKCFNITLKLQLQFKLETRYSCDQCTMERLWSLMFTIRRIWYITRSSISNNK